MSHNQRNYRDPPDYRNQQGSRHPNHSNNQQGSRPSNQSNNQPFRHPMRPAMQQPGQEMNLVFVPVPQQFQGMHPAAYASMQPQGQGMQPNYASMPPQGQGMQPDYASMPPQGQGMQPTYASMPPRGQGMQPDYAQMPPQGQGMQPDYASMPPQGQGMQPTYASMPPRGQGMQPDYAQMPPQGQGMQPDYASLPPQGQGMQPDYAQMPPQGQGMQPTYASMPPQGQGMHPSYAPTPPQGQGMHPGYPPMPPQGQGMQPEYGPMPPRGQGMQTTYASMPPQGQGMHPSYAPTPPQGQGMHPGYPPMPPQGQGMQPEYGPMPPRGQGMQTTYASMPPQGQGMHPSYAPTPQQGQGMQTGRAPMPPQDQVIDPGQAPLPPPQYYQYQQQQQQAMQTVPWDDGNMQNFGSNAPQQQYQPSGHSNNAQYQQANAQMYCAAPAPMTQAQSHVNDQMDQPMVQHHSETVQNSKPAALEPSYNQQVPNASMPMQPKGNPNNAAQTPLENMVQTLMKEHFDQQLFIQNNLFKEMQKISTTLERVAQKVDNIDDRLTKIETLVSGTRQVNVHLEKLDFGSAMSTSNQSTTNSSPPVETPVLSVVEDNAQSDNVIPDVAEPTESILEPSIVDTDNKQIENVQSHTLETTDSNPSSLPEQQATAVASGSNILEVMETVQEHDTLTESAETQRELPTDNVPLYDNPSNATSTSTNVPDTSQSAQETDSEQVESPRMKYSLVAALNISQGSQGPSTSGSGQNTSTGQSQPSSSNRSVSTGRNHSSNVNRNNPRGRRQSLNSNRNFPTGQRQSSSSNRNIPAGQRQSSRSAQNTQPEPRQRMSLPPTLPTQKTKQSAPSPFKKLGKLNRNVTMRNAEAATSSDAVLEPVVGTAENTSVEAGKSTSDSNVSSMTGPVDDHSSDLTRPKKPEFGEEIEGRKNNSTVNETDQTAPPIFDTTNQDVTATESGSKKVANPVAVPEEEAVEEVPEPSADPNVPSTSEPVEPPSEPVGPPSEPVEPPSEPVKPPSEQVGPPSEPVEPPSEPVKPPSEQVGPPSAPVGPPSEPVGPPSEPVGPPSEPVEPPSEPVESPSEPVEAAEERKPRNRRNRNKKRREPEEPPVAPATPVDETRQGKWRRLIKSKMRAKIEFCLKERIAGKPVNLPQDAYNKWTALSACADLNKYYLDAENANKMLTPEEVVENIEKLANVEKKYDTTAFSELMAEFNELSEYWKLIRSDMSFLVSNSNIVDSLGYYKAITGYVSEVYWMSINKYAKLHEELRRNPKPVRHHLTHLENCIVQEAKKFLDKQKNSGKKSSLGRFETSNVFYERKKYHDENVEKDRLSIYYEIIGNLDMIKTYPTSQNVLNFDFHYLQGEYKHVRNKPEDFTEKEVAYFEAISKY